MSLEGGKAGREGGREWKHDDLVAQLGVLISQCLHGARVWRVYHQSGTE